MRLSISSVLALSAVSNAVATAVVGKAHGFAAGTTGGGDLTPSYPKDIYQLKSWLEDTRPRVIVMNREYNFIGSEGEVTATGCRPSSNTCAGNGGQDAINGANWCDKGLAAKSPRVQVTYDQAALNPINVNSHKSLVGVGANAILRGKGLRIANGAKNVIIQNIHITELNPQYIWGGDAITLAGTDLVWIDHVKFSLIGRQMFVAGYAASNRVTLSNSEFDGQTPWSASCDGRHYWTMLLLGDDDQITLNGNYIHHTSGRGPKVGGNTLLHAVNNYWYSITGHAFDNETTGKVLAEGNVFDDVADTLLPISAPGKLFSPASRAVAVQCFSTSLKRRCKLNVGIDSTPLAGDSEAILSGFPAAYAAPATIAFSVKYHVLRHSGVGKI